MHPHISRRSLLKSAALGLSSAPFTARIAAAAQDKPAVYFTKDLSAAGLLQIYARINTGLTGKIGIKLHSGEPNGPNLLPIDFIKGLQPAIPNSTIVECNVLYPSPRADTNTHRQTLKTNGFTFCPVDIMDAEGEVSIPIPGMKELLSSSGDSFAQGRHLTEVGVGRNLLNYDSLLVYTHFKGHTMGGFGGSLKNISIGCASGKGGKLQIHDSGWPKGPLFLERMVEGGKAVTAHFGAHIAYINVLKNLSVDCDCDSHAAKPTAPDIGILGSTDILAIDQASIDLAYALPGDLKKDLVERIESRSGLHQLEHMEKLKMGSRRYELVTLNSPAADPARRRG